MPAPVDFPPIIAFVPLSLLGGLLGLDVVSFPQAMISRPIVAATLGGAFAGHAMAGLVCGAALECLAVESLPVGASRYPEWGSASTVAGVLAAQSASSVLPNGGSLAIAVVLGILTAWIGGWTMVRHRKLIATWARPRLDRLAAGDRGTVVSLQLFGMTADLVRGTLLTLVMLVPGMWFTGWANARWTVSSDVSRAFVVTSVAAVAAAAIWKDFHAIAGTRRLFLAALAIGTVGVILHG